MKIVFRFEIFAENQQLQKNQQKTENNGEITEGQRKIQMCIRDSFADVHKLTEILRRLAEGGNTVVVIEHNLDVIKTADYIIDVGPEGGARGGTIVACGTPEEIAENPNSYTGIYIRKFLERDK